MLLFGHRSPKKGRLCPKRGVEEVKKRNLVKFLDIEARKIEKMSREQRKFGHRSPKKGRLCPKRGAKEEEKKN